MPSAVDTTVDTNTLARTVATLNISNVNTGNQSLTTQSEVMSVETLSSLRVHNQLYNSITSGQEMEVACIKRSIEEQFDRFQAEMNKNHAQAQLLSNATPDAGTVTAHTEGTPREASRDSNLHQQTRDELVTKQKEMIQLQQYDKVTNPFSEQFRLYLLCECGV